MGGWTWIFKRQRTAEKPGGQKLLQETGIGGFVAVLYRAHQPYHEPIEKLVPAAP
jgi:hypothetical protein